MAPSLDVLSSLSSFAHSRLDNPYIPLSSGQWAKPGQSAARNWPTSSGALTWAGSDFVSENEYVLHFDEDDLKEIEHALQHFKNLRLDASKVDPETFPLPNVHHMLVQAGRDLYEGRGFSILRGIDSQAYSVEDNVLISLGVTSHIQRERTSQNSRGQMIRHIVDASWTGVPITDRPSGYSNHAQYFHNDFACEILVLYAVNSAAKGGFSNLASGWKIYNDLAQNRPDILDLLSKCDWATEDDGSAAVPYINRTVLHFVDGKPMFNLERRTLMGAPYAPRPSEIPAMSSAQIEALDMIQTLAEKYQLSTSIRPGDIRLVNNYAVLHSRESFQDDDVKRRHLVRLWLKRNPGEVGWKLPEELERIVESRSSGRKVKADWNVALEVEAKEVYAQARETCDGGSARFDM